MNQEDLTLTLMMSPFVNSLRLNALQIATEKKCFKSYCYQCNSFEGCQCSCGESDHDDSDGSECDKAWLPDPKAWLPKPKMKYCDCKECDCAQNKIPDEEDLG